LLAPLNSYRLADCHIGGGGGGGGWGGGGRVVNGG